VILSDQSEQQYISELDIVETIFLILILLAGCILVTRDSLKLVIRPLDKMLALIKNLTENTSYQSSDLDSDDLDEDLEDEGAVNSASAAEQIEMTSSEVSHDEYL
jgi:hypothetical protein